MASERLQVILDLETGQYTRKARQASDSTREIGTSADKTGTKLQSLEKKLRRTGIAAAAALGAGAAAFGASAIRSASDLGESINAVEKAFEDGAETVLAFSDQAATSAGLSAAAFNQLVVPIGALLRNFGLSAQEAGEQAVALTQRAADLASVFNTDVATALGAIQAALRGEGDPIEQFGANVSAARIEAYALAEGLVETKSEIDDNVKVMARLGLIFQDTERFAGDFADTADSVANKVRTLTGEWENFKASTGEDLLEPAGDALTLAGRLVTAFATAVNFAKNPLDEVQRTIDQIPVSVNRLRREVGGFQGQEGAAFLQLLSNIPRQALESTDVIEGFADAVGLTSEDLQDINDILGDDGSWDSYGDAVDRLAEILGITREEAEALLPIIQGLEDGLRDQGFIESSKRAWEAYAAQLGISAGVADDAADSNNELADSFLNVLNARRELQDPLFAAAQSQQRKSSARDTLNEAIESGDVEKIARARLDYISATAEADIATENFAGTFTESFDAVLESSEGTRDDLLETLEVLGLLEDLRPVDLIITSASIDEINRSAATLIRNIEILRGVGPGPVESEDPRFDQPRGFASGGYANAHETIIVGERGPELIRPRVPIEVIPNHQIGTAGGTSQVTYVNVSAEFSGVIDRNQAQSFVRWINEELARTQRGTV